MDRFKNIFSETFDTRHILKKYIVRIVAFTPQKLPDVSKVVISEKVEEGTTTWSTPAHRS